MSANQYGHLRGKKKGEGRAWRLVVAGLFLSGSLAIFTWNAQQVGVLLGHHPRLGSPLGRAGGRVWYGPWKILEWGELFREHGPVTRLIDQSYLFGVWLPVLIFLVYWASRQGLKGRDDLHGSARWAKLPDIQKMGYLENEGVYIGGWWEERHKIHHYLRHNGPEHVLCFAPTRSGKGVGLILPTLLSWPHSSVVLDIKGENFALTSGYLAGLGHKVLRFDPSDAEGTSAAFNPLEEIRLDSALAIPDVQQIAAMVMDPQGKGLEDYWSKAAFGFFGGAVLHALIMTLKEKNSPASLYDVAVLLEDPKRPVKEVFEEMLKTDHAALMAELFPALVSNNPANPYGQAAHVFIASAARGMLSKAEQELSGVVNTATSNLALYKDPIVAGNIARCDFRINDLMNFDKPVNLYLVISPADIDRLRPLLRIFVAQMLGRLTEKMEFEDRASKAAYRHRMLLMLDEFTSLGKLAIVERAIAYMAGYGLKGYFIVQDTKQLTQAYGQDNALMANCHIRIAYAPNLPETAEYLSKMAGTTTVVDKKVSISGVGGKGGSSRSLNMAETSRPLLTPDECMRLPGLSKDAAGNPLPGDMFIFTAGHPPIYGRQILYFVDPVFSRRAKVKVPGVAQGFRRGLSASLYFSRPGEGKPVQEPVLTESSPPTEGDFADEYKNFWPNKALGLALSLVGLVFLTLAWGGYRFNFTPSQPRGLYRLVPEKPGRGDYVAFCLDQGHPLADLAAQRGYLGRGGCRSGRQPLLKRLLGLPGDYVSLEAEGWARNGQLLPGSKRLEVDSQGRPTPPSLLAPGLIPAGLALVLSQDHPGSFDSRYFGLIPLASLQKAEPVLLIFFK